MKKIKFNKFALLTVASLSILSACSDSSVTKPQATAPIDSPASGASVSGATSPDAGEMAKPMPDPNAKPSALDVPVEQLPGANKVQPGLMPGHTISR
jgi:hypothetical protein